MGEKRNVYRLLVGKPEGKRPLGKPRCRWVDNIRIYLEEVGWGDGDWIGLTQDRHRWRTLVNSALNLIVLQMLGNNQVASKVVTVEYSMIGICTSVNSQVVFGI
jgi:hypothetical protein